MELTAVQISRLTGTSKANISKLTKNESLIRNENKKYDLSNPINSDYLFRHGITEKDLEKVVLSKSKKNIDKTTNNNNVSNKKVKNTQNNKERLTKVVKKEVIKKDIKTDNKDEIITDEGIERLLGQPQECLKMTLEQIVLEHGGIQNLKLYAETLDRQLSAAKKAVEIQKIKSEMVSRDFVKSHVLNYLNILSAQLFDYADEDEKMCKDFAKIIQHAQKQLDREFEKLEIIKEAQK